MVQQKPDKVYKDHCSRRKGMELLSVFFNIHKKQKIKTTYLQHNCRFWTSPVELGHFLVKFGKN